MAPLRTMRESGLPWEAVGKSERGGDDMMAIDDPTEVSAPRAASALQRGQTIPTGVSARPKRTVSAAGQVYLRPGDELCEDCDEDDNLIGEFGSAPYVPVLGRIKRRYGTTLCQDCHLKRGKQ